MLSYFRKPAIYACTFLVILNGFLLIESYFISYSSPLFIQKSYAHFEHFTHYNNRGEGVGKYYVYQAVDPEYVHHDQPSKIMFSIQDENGNDVKNVGTMVEVYAADNGKRVNVYPWAIQEVGDFEVEYNFPRNGNYQVVLSIANNPDFAVSKIGIVDPPRDTLSGTMNCDCDRAIFNISVAENFGTIYNSIMLVVIIAPIIVFGSILGTTFINKRKNKSLYPDTGNKEALKWSVMLLAIAGGLVHLAVFSEHASLRLEYSIFLLAAGGIQIAYGVMYILVTLSGELKIRTTAALTGQSLKEDEKLQSIALARLHYRKTVAVNLFGLVGTAVLLGLYTYTLVFPPPMSPNNEPEQADFAGILAKSIELILVIGIVYLLHWEKKRMESQVIRSK
jgi:hypothetical protein